MWSVVEVAKLHLDHTPRWPPEITPLTAPKLHHVRGRYQDVESLNDAMQWHMHYVARGGIASFAISAVDIALWDLRGKRTGQALWQMAGGAGKTCRAYCGGIDLGFSLPKLLDSVQSYLDRGFNGVKIKIGKPTLSEDIARIKAVRDLIGPDITFMVDGLCCTNPVRDSSRESSMVAGMHEQTHTPNLQDQELASLQ